MELSSLRLHMTATAGVCRLQKHTDCSPLGLSTSLRDLHRSIESCHCRSALSPPCSCGPSGDTDMAAIRLQNAFKKQLSVLDG